LRSAFLYVCPSVRLFVCLSFFRQHYLKNHLSKFYEIFSTCYLWRGPVFLDERAIFYVLPVLWMTSHNGDNGQSQRRRVCFVEFSRWQHRGGVVAVYDLLLVYTYYSADVAAHLWCSPGRCRRSMSAVRPTAAYC